MHISLGETFREIKGKVGKWEKRRGIQETQGEYAKAWPPTFIDEVVYRWNIRKASQTERLENMFAKSIGLVVTWDGLKLCQAAWTF